LWAGNNGMHFLFVLPRELCLSLMWRLCTVKWPYSQFVQLHSYLLELPLIQELLK
jgi:hypothetical protein